MKVFIETYGCTFNQADSEIMAGVLNENNIEIVGTQEEADAIIVNTCYVKLPTESKVINRIRNLQEEFPDKKIIVGGCMVEVDPKKLDAIGPNCSWIGPHQLNKTADVVKSAIAGEVFREFGFSDEPKVCVPKIRQDPYIHVIQICEGCLGSCTYCCTRFARGHLNSYPIADIVEEARRAIEDGCVEIQLTAQDTSAFGKDTGEKLSDLIREVANLDGDFRVRVGMMHPKNIGNDLEDLIDAFKLEKVYKFIHLPIQSGSDAVLKHMRRNHTVEDYKKIVYRMSRGYYKTLMEAGVQIYEYTPGFVHAKGCIIDGNIATIGTVNLDYRSLFLHFENNSVFFKSKMIEDFKADFLKTQSKSTLRTLADLKTGDLRWFVDGILRIFAPLC